MVIAGYCFWRGCGAGSRARRHGLLAGFVSFHGGLETPEGQDYSATPAPVMVLHGSADPVSGMAELATLMDELQAAEVPHEARHLRRLRGIPLPCPARAILTKRRMPARKPPFASFWMRGF